MSVTEEKDPNYHPGHKTTPGNAPGSYKSLVKFVCPGVVMFEDTTPRPVRKAQRGLEGPCEESLGGFRWWPACLCHISLSINRRLTWVSPLKRTGTCVSSRAWPLSPRPWTTLFKRNFNVSVTRFGCCYSVPLENHELLAYK